MHLFVRFCVPPLRKSNNFLEQLCKHESPMQLTSRCVIRFLSVSKWLIKALLVFLFDIVQVIISFSHQVEERVTTLGVEVRAF